MTSYTTLDYLPDLTANRMSSAELLTFSPLVEPSSVGWENSASVSGSEPNAILHSIYRFDAKEGATYSIFSTSALDPFIVLIYDNLGNAIQANDESDDPASSTLGSEDVIFNWIAPYTGTYYVDASWNQENFQGYYSLRIYEDIDTAVPTKDIVPAVDTSLAESYLANYGITIQQANEFILSHVNEPSTIYNVAKQFGVTTLMLSEITGYSTNDISAFFASFGMDSTELDTVNSSSGTRDLLAPDMASFENIITLNNNSGVLSTASLRESVLSSPGVTESIYYSKFDPNNFKGAGDGIFTPEELGGITKLGNIPATIETLESLFYGTAINAYKNFDFDEFVTIAANANPENITKVRGLEISAYASPTGEPFYENSEDLAFNITNAVIVGWNSDNNSFFDGILLYS